MHSGSSEPTRRRSIVVGVAVTALVAVVTVVIGTRLSSDDVSSGDEIAEAWFRFEGSLDYGDDKYIVLRDCPLGDVTELARSMAEVVDVGVDVVAGEAFAEAFERSREYPSITQCFVSSDPEDGVGSTAVGVSVADVPRGAYQDFLSSTAYDPDVQVSIDVQRRHDGPGPRGDVYGYCYRAVDLSGCAADLVDRMNGVVFSVYLQGASRRAEEAVDVLDELLFDLIENLEDYVATNPVPVTVPDALGDA
jgi:hypothetical protein